MNKLFKLTLLISTLFMNYSCQLLNDNCEIKTQIRGIWHRPFSCDYDETNLEGIDNLLKDISNTGFNLIYVEMMIDGYTLYESSNFDTYYKVVDSYYDENYKNDYLNAFIDTAHKYNIEVYAWQSIFYVGSHNYLSSSINEEWLIKDLNGDNKVYNDYGYSYVLDPSNPEVINFLLNEYEPLLKKYDFQGFQLDYIRYTENDYYNEIIEDYGFTDYSINDFNKKYKLNFNPQKDIYNEDIRNKWHEYKTNNITNAVEKMSNYVKLINPNMKISACAYMSSYDAKNVYCQDVNEWIKNKYIDLLCPMIYTLDNNYFLECINDYKKICKNRYLLSIGIAPLYLGSSLEENNNQIKNGNKLSNGISYFASHNIFKNNKEEKMASIKEYL